MTTTLTRKDVIDLLRSKLERADMTLKLLGEELGGKKPISPTYLHDVMKGRKRPGKQILNALGLELERKEVYRKVSKPA